MVNLQASSAFGEQKVVWKRKSRFGGKKKEKRRKDEKTKRPIFFDYLTRFFFHPLEAEPGTFLVGP